MPTDIQTQKLKERLLKWCNKYNLPKDSIQFISPHRLADKNRTCYGKLLSNDWAVRLLTEIKRSPEEERKKREIENQIKFLSDIIQILSLKLKIAIGKHLEIVNKRSLNNPNNN
jgi:hypothetical protein